MTRIAAPPEAEALATATSPETNLPEHPAKKNALLVEVALAFSAATSVAAVLYRVRALDSYFHAAVAFLFLYLPIWLLRRHDLGDYGLTQEPLRRNLALLFSTVALVFPLFALGFYLWSRLACGSPLLSQIAPGPCGVAVKAMLRLPPHLPSLALAEVLVVALPEEFFFRGYVQGRLAEALRKPGGARLLGASSPVAILVASSLFALCHLVVQGNPLTLAVFFPGLLFGWMRDRTGSVLPGTLFHALCNLYIETLHRSFFG